MSKIDFTNPFLGRKWLLSLISSPKFGLSFKPSMDFDESYFGFSFKSNEHGLRGPSNAHADNVICGTSFGMGLSVDNGHNWYEISDHFSDYFNISMPVGTQNHLNRLKALYKGSYNKLLYVYHPNIWSISKNFERSIQENKNVADLMAWRTDYPSVINLYFKKIVKSAIKRANGKLLYRTDNNKCYRLDVSYSLFDMDNNIEFTETELKRLMCLFKSFKKVKIVRVPIKEQVYYQKEVEPKLKSLNQNYDDNWSALKNRAKHSTNVEIIDLCKKNIFDMDDYLPFDTHWSEKGNRKFFEQVINIV